MGSKRWLPGRARPSSYSKILYMFAYLYNISLRYPRLSRLHVSPHVTNWKNLKEAPKVALYGDRRYAILSGLIHVVPLTTAIALIVVNARRTYIGAMSTTTLTAIQFAAKLLETLAQASLAAVSLGLLRHQLLGPGAVPLGGLLGPYRIRDISYLWSLEFWGQLTTNQCSRCRKTLLAFFIPAIVILVALIGPSSAILLIPRRNNYPMGRWLIIFNETELEFSGRAELTNGFLANEMSVQEALPDLVHDRENPKDDLSVTESIIFDYHGGRVMKSWVSEVDESAEKTQLVFGSTIPAKSTGCAFASLASTHEASSTSKRASVFRTSSLQPYVQQDCILSQVKKNQSPEKDFVSFGADHPDLNALVRLASILPNMTNPSTEPFLLANWSLQTNSSKISFYEPPPTSTYSLLGVRADARNSRDYPFELNACIFEARWAKSSANFTLASSIVSAQKSKDWLQTPSKIISISPSWAGRVWQMYLNITGDISDAPFKMSDIFAFTLSNSGVDPPVIQPGRLTSFDKYGGSKGFVSSEQYRALSEFVDRMNYRHHYYSVNVYAQGNWTDPTSLAQYPIEALQEGYGWDSSTVPVRLSLVVLGIYSLIVSAYLLYIFISGRSANSWSSTGDLVMLALNSKKPEHLSGTSVGTETLSTFGEPVNLRVNEEDKSVELVFQNDPGLKKRVYTAVEPNKRY